MWCLIVSIPDLCPLSYFDHLKKPLTLCLLTHISRMELTTLTNWVSLFLFKGLLGGSFHFYSHFNRIFCMQTVKTLIRRHVLWRLIWVCTVCLCPTKRTLGLYGLKTNYAGGKKLICNWYMYIYMLNGFI